MEVTCTNMLVTSMRPVNENALPSPAHGHVHSYTRVCIHVSACARAFVFSQLRAGVRACARAHTHTCTHDKTEEPDWRAM